MKIRLGHVTNSSSSSFVVVLKRDLSDDQIKDKINSIFRIDENHILKPFVDQIIRCFVSRLARADKYNRKDLHSLVDDYDWEEVTDMLVEYGNVSIGRFGDDGGDTEEMWLCYNDLNYEDDDIIILHDGGY